MNTATRNPVEALLDKVEWEKLPDQASGEIPHATHKGILKIGDRRLKVYQLSDGNRIIDETDLFDFFSD